MPLLDLPLPCHCLPPPCHCCCLAFHCLVTAFHRLVTAVAWPSTALSLPSTELSLPLLGLPPPFHCLSLSFRGRLRCTDAQDLLKSKDQCLRDAHERDSINRRHDQSMQQIWNVLQIVGPDHLGLRLSRPSTSSRRHDYTRRPSVNLVPQASGHRPCGKYGMPFRLLALITSDCA